MSDPNLKRIMLLGQIKVGKTSIINHILKNRLFETEHYPTVGVEAGIKAITFDDNKFAIVQIWDTAGKHQFHQYVCSKFYHDMDAFLIVIDLQNQNTLASVNFWKQQIKKVRKSQTGYVIGVLANKSDLKHTFDTARFRSMYPNISFYREISVKQSIQPNQQYTNAESAIFQFVRQLYSNKLPQVAIQHQQKTPICNSCVIM